MPVKLKRLLLYLRREGPVVAVLPILAAFLVTGVLFHTLNGRLRPVLEAAASSQATNLMTQAIAAAVDNCLQENSMGYSDFVTLEKDAAGKVTSITSNTTANSRFKRQVVEAVARQLSALDSSALGVPLGTLTGQPLLSGLEIRENKLGERPGAYLLGRNSLSRVSH